MTDTPSPEALAVAREACNPLLCELPFIGDPIVNPGLILRYQDADRLFNSVALAIDRAVAQERERGNSLRDTIAEIRSSIFYWMTRNHPRGERSYAQLGEAKEKLTIAIKRYEEGEQP